jgi:thiol-disulfide isomerase/thioredoxin
MKPLIIGITIVFVIGAAGLFYFLRQSPVEPKLDDRPQTISPQNEEIVDTMIIDSNLTVGDESSPSPELRGNYIAGMGPDAFKYSTADKIVLFFYADWCPTCRPIDLEFKNSLKIPLGVEIYRINYNDEDTDEEEKALASKYGVTYQHTFVQVDKEGNEITKWNGGGLEKLISSVK